MFKPGDRIECLSNLPGIFTRGKIYIVKSCGKAPSGNYVRVALSDDGNAQTWMEWHFKLAQTLVNTNGSNTGTAPSNQASTFKVGDLVEWAHTTSIWEIVGDLGNDFEIELVFSDPRFPGPIGQRIYHPKSSFSSATLVPSPTSSVPASNVVGGRGYTLPTTPMHISVHMTSGSSTGEVREAVGQAIEGSSGCECGNKKNPIGQGHSDWCKLFKREF